MHQLVAKRTTSTTDRAELAYWVHYAPVADAPCLLLIHGGSSNHTRWSEFVETSKLTRSWNIIVPDMRGNGESMTRAHINMSTWCGDLLDILAAEKAQNTAIIGHSLGAQIAIHFADRHSDKTQGLILIDPIFQCSLHGRSLWVRRYHWLVRGVVAVVLGLNALGLRRRNFQTHNLQELDLKTREAIQRAQSFAEIEKRYSALGPILKHMPVANYLRQALATVSPLPPLQGISVPVLALLSGGTTVGDLKLNRQEVERLGNSEIVVLDANHWPLTETPDAVREAIEEWVLRTWPTTEGIS